MTQSSADPKISEHVPPSAPVPETPTAGLPERPSVSDAALREHADKLARGWEMARGDPKQAGFSKRIERLENRLAHLLARCRAITVRGELTPPLELLESSRMMESAITAGSSATDTFVELPHVRVETQNKLPRVMNLAEGYLSAAGGIWSPDSLTIYVQQIQYHDALLLDEVMALPQALKLAQLEYILDRADEVFAAGKIPPIEQSPFSAVLHSLRRLNQVEWRNILEPLVAFDPILRNDPACVFARMEDESRNIYQLRIAELAKRADTTEMETAQIALQLAMEAKAKGDPDPRRAFRTMHIGYYMFAEGLPALMRRIRYQPALIERLQAFVRRNNEDFYIDGILILTLVLIVAVIAPLVPHHAFWPVMGALLLALVPASQGGVDLMNNTVTALIKTRSLPKVDFSKGVPRDATTFIVVPTLLLNEKQVEDLFEELEARYLSNQDPNIHFGLLTDLPDAEARPQNENEDPLVKLAVQRTDELNAKYAGQNGGSFVLMHRHRVYNSRQGVWMGWERKRGKLLDLNKYLRHEFDSFPIKAGPIEVLGPVKYVITLDSDTQLPRGTAARMIGTLAHPLNCAIVDSRLRIVTAGYGILQPRVGVSVSSASRSRFASMYSGETGFDIYTRAVSDVYQDLFGEGIFAGKGIYEAAILHQVLDRRFPRDALLSHDLIEGSYARAGLVSDIEVIDDYPSHYSAHTRRQHRWVRGDWQVAQWLFSRVPDESGKMVPNPINTISRWKILDNLRRSLVQPFTFIMLVLGWFFLPGGALYWTIATLLLLLLPVLVQLGFNFTRALLNLSVVGVREALSTFASSFGFAILNLTFLPHHMLMSLDAIARSLGRQLLSGRRLLEWETAAQAETSRSRSTLDRYLLLSPLIAVSLGVILAFTHLHSLYAAAPVLLLWAVAPLVAGWLNSLATQEEGPLSASDRHFLLVQALYIWRYFLEFADESNHWLIPDNVEEKNTYQVRKLSPTNLGMLFNARQAACELGFLTLPEFARATLGTLATYDSLEKHRGHIYNWYDIDTLKAIPPLTISAVDSGNLAASLYTLHTGALDLLKRPILSTDSLAGIELLTRIEGKKSAINGIFANGLAEPQSVRNALTRLLDEAGNSRPAEVRNASENGWAATEAERRRSALREFVANYTPWLQPRFALLFELFAFHSEADRKVPALERADEYARGLVWRLAQSEKALPPELAPVAAELRSLVGQSIHNLGKLKHDISEIAAKAEHAADAMEYGFMYVESRKLLSIGFDGSTGELHSACYDLLASEARIASFLAVAKGDIPQQSWFRLDRSHVLVDGRPALLSWTGTMFEYLMPALWMRAFPDTLIAQSLESAVYIQRRHVRNIPWGISESGFAKMDPLGRYSYQAWGIPQLALKYGAEDGPVISPYSTFLALPISRREAIANLRRMEAMKWTGAYGFYEAADYTQGKEPVLVRSWMAHHQGMCLLAVTNLLRENVIQRWFHGTPRVRAAELLLH
ncbi:MAG: glycosyl transferase, partial [Silvibacterium sp.]|nr:glycosyl transferase [Silvibacterium sp.]